MNEANFSRRLVHALRSLGFYVQRIENSITSGMPDIYAILDGGTVWVECKVTPKVTQEPRFERNQIFTMETMVLHGADVVVAIGSEDGFRIRIVETGSMTNEIKTSVGELAAFIASHVLRKH